LSVLEIKKKVAERNALTKEIYALHKEKRGGQENEEREGHQKGV